MPRKKKTAETLSTITPLPPGPPVSVLSVPRPGEAHESERAVRTPSRSSRSVEPQEIAVELRALSRSIDSLRLDEKNARTHPEQNLRSIEASLRAHGQRKPIVVRNGVVLAGNGTLIAAKALGWTRLACVEYEGPEALARAYAIADNRSAELAEWDPDALLRSLQEADGAGLLDATGYAEDAQALLEDLNGGDQVDAGLAIDDVDASHDEGFVRFSFGSHAAMVAREVYERFVAKVQESRKDSPETLIDDVFRDLLDVSEQTHARQ